MIVVAGTVVGSITVAGTGEPWLLTKPNIVEAAIVVPGITVVPGMYPEIHVGVDWDTDGETDTVLKVLHADNEIVLSSIVVPSIIVAGIGELFLSTEPGIVDGLMVTPGMIVVPDV